MKTSARLSISYFKAHCTQILRDLEKRPAHWRILVTNRDRVIATVAPGNEGAPVDPAAWLGSLQGTVLRFDEPLAPAADSGEWSALNR
jgi:hypothetical protein